MMKKMWVSMYPLQPSRNIMMRVGWLLRLTKYLRTFLCGQVSIVDMTLPIGRKLKDLFQVDLIR